MKVFGDTSVLVPALWKWHPDHTDCVAWLVAAASGAVELCTTAHCLAETFSVLTRLPIQQRIKPAEAWDSLAASVLPHVNMIELSSAVYVSALRELAGRGIGGGMAYDALIAAGAELAQVDLLITGNVRHFETVWPNGIGRIVSPKSITPPESP